MNLLPGKRTVLILALAAAQVFAQGWDPVRKASGWARVDQDGSVAFYDPARKVIVSWMRDGGVMAEVDVSKLAQAPEKWVLDSSFNAWVVSGRNLQFVGRDGTVFGTKLPYEVGDLSWDAQGLYLSYRCPEPYVEKRGYEAGSVVWYVKSRTMKDETAAAVQSRVSVTEDRTVVVSQRDGLQLDRYDGANGHLKDHLVFTYKGKPAPALVLGSQDRRPMAWWLDKNIALQAVPASQVPSLGMIGLLLAKEDLGKGTVDFIPTGLSEAHEFIGVIDADAVFIAPAGGLVFLPI